MHNIIHIGALTKIQEVSTPHLRPSKFNNSLSRSRFQRTTGNCGGGVTGMCTCWGCATGCDSCTASDTDDENGLIQMTQSCQDCLD